MYFLSMIRPTELYYFINLASKFIGIFNLVLLLLLLGHWNACLQFLIPMLHDYPVESWVAKGKLQ
ncbi:Potassium/sodium hyperpolarization-activated cyclic nucleotide-gated channel 3, partial [Schistosoma japonicum]